MNGLEKPFRKKSDPKNWKNSKNQSEIAACEQKTTTDKANFCSNTIFSLYFKIRAIKFHAAKPLAFSLHFLFRCDQNHCSNLTSKIMKMCEQILKKRAPQYNSNSLNCKKTKRRPIIAPAIAVRLLKNIRGEIIAGWVWKTIRNQITATKLLRAVSSHQFFRYIWKKCLTLSTIYLIPDATFAQCLVFSTSHHSPYCTIPLSS